MFLILFSIVLSAQANIENLSLSDVLVKLGANKTKHFILPDQEKIAIGKQLVNVKKISKLFKCIDCHSTKADRKNLLENNANARLAYSIENSLPILPAPTFFGIVNRTSWFSNAYQSHYKVDPGKAFHDLSLAIQFCAENYSSGRKITEDETEAILNYFWTLEYKVKDLDLNQQLIRELKKTLDQGLTSNSLVVKIKRHYLPKDSVSLGGPPRDLETGYSKIKGNASNGQAIFNISCKHCHQKGGPAIVHFKDHIDTFELLNENIPSPDNMSIYFSVRKGSEKVSWDPSYMPAYPLEKLSNQHLEDLRAYIQKKYLELSKN